MADKPTKPTKPRKPKTDAAEVVDPFAYLFAGYDGTASKAKTNQSRAGRVAGRLDQGLHLRY